MARFKYFHDTATQTFELTGIFYGNDFKPHGWKSPEDKVFVQGVGWTGHVPATRTVEYKTNPSKHKCDARCQNATGRVMKCECSCNGKNHGRGFAADEV